VDFATKVIEQGTADPQKACDTGKVAVSAAVKVAEAQVRSEQTCQAIVQREELLAGEITGAA
jgi:hypothetical protein